MSEPRARNSYRFEIHIFFLPRSSVDEPSRVRGWSRPSGSLFTKSVTKSVASVTKSPTAMTTVAEIAAPRKDVTPLIEHEPSADAKTESVTKPVASVTKSPTAMTPVTKKRGRPAANGKAMTPAEKRAKLI
jgi:hypothetical protein